MNDSHIIRIEQINEFLKLHNSPKFKAISQREYEVFGKEGYKNIKDISPSHIYNLRGTRLFKGRYLLSRRFRQKSKQKKAYRTYQTL